ncbi:hypothetical protein B296_00009102 [Ensete ventricosum]|uniref:Uncharacterized protein n=1 Tax=Ensete ventricosum TaxID=4639 RepID=A0A426ZS67_ENSVE|nr:hypothetical protein B296_00009102 [Ensete ventricosum]
MASVSARCWQRPHIEKSWSEFITQESVCNGDVTRRRYGAADRGGIVRGNAIHADLTVGELDCFSAHIRLREPDKSEDKAESSMAAGRRIIVANSMQGVQTLLVLQKCEQRAGEC